jgi:glycosyltransferase involved in cell wall biosynthesis
MPQTGLMTTHRVSPASPASAAARFPLRLQMSSARALPSLRKPTFVKIAQIAPLYESVPPKLYGGTERVVASLCDALVDLGHDVTLFSSADARTKARLVALRDQAIRLDDSGAPSSDVAAHLVLLHEVRRQASHFDVLHFHLDLLHLPLFEQLAEKCVTTLHGRLDIKDLPAVFDCWPTHGLVSISNHQRRPVPNAKWLATVPHGLPAGQFTFNPSPAGEYFAFLGRISPEKGPETAIRLAIRAGVPLKIAAKVDDVDKAYFKTVIEPLLEHPLIEFIGEIGEAHKSQFLGNARGLLFPIRWPEPFGLVLIEAMACGTPVIAYRCGAVPEIIQQGVSGFIIKSPEQAINAMGRIDCLDRRAVRCEFERRFTAQHMACAYVDVYAGLIDSRRFARAS